MALNPEQATDEGISTAVDMDTPNAARVYDYYLGGGHNFPCDRELAEQVLRVFPDAPGLARRARRWLRLAVDVLATECGVDQFLDLGAGIPSAGCTHEVARNRNPAARVLYVDNEPVAVASTRAQVDGLDGVEIANADFTNPAAVLEHPLTRATLDFSRPIAVIFSCTLHLVPDSGNPAGIVTAFRDATPSGSYLAISHGTPDNRPDFAAVAELYKNASNPFVPRPYAEVAALFDGYELIPPGLTFTGKWRPESEEDTEEADRSGCYAGVGRKQ